MNTKAAHKRFWAAIGERYGQRWFADYGAEPNRAWIEMLDRYTPADITDALALLAKRPEMHQHPPTMPQFENLLMAAVRGRKASDGPNYRRDYWRSRIAGEVRRELARRGLWADPFTDETTKGELES